ncbi:MAG: hypothetical protein ABSB79_04450 [Syntrophales bacterium]|jgi:enoyl-CoA hydratase/carnithine racemase
MEKDGTVAVLIMNTVENRHNLDFTNAMLKAFDEIETDQSISAVVVASSDKKNWSLGIDLTWVANVMNTKEFDEMKEFMHHPGLCLRLQVHEG